MFDGCLIVTRDRRRRSGPIRLGVGSRPATRRENIPGRFSGPGPISTRVRAWSPRQRRPILRPGRRVARGLSWQAWEPGRTTACAVRFRPPRRLRIKPDRPRGLRPGSPVGANQGCRHGATARPFVVRLTAGVGLGLHPDQPALISNRHPVGFVRPGHSTVPDFMGFYDPTIRSVVLAIGSEA